MGVWLLHNQRKLPSTYKTRILIKINNSKDESNDTNRYCGRGNFLAFNSAIRKQYLYPSLAS